jgi:hypothetical protein
MIVKIHQHVITYSLTRAIKKFGKLAKQSAHGKMKQLHDRKCFQAIYSESLSDFERKRAIESLLFVVEKKSGLLKSRHCANGIWVSSEPQKPNSNPKTELKCQFYTNLCKFCTRKKLNLKTRIETQNQN